MSKKYRTKAGAYYREKVLFNIIMKTKDEIFSGWL
jgi:hypothetical protein